MKLLSISNYVPEQIADVIRFDQSSSASFRQTHYCPYLAACVSHVLDDPSVDGLVFPSSCDGARSMDAYLMGSGKFIHKLVVPAISGELGVQRFAESIKTYRCAIEEYFDITISDSYISERAMMVRERGLHLAHCYDSLPFIRYSDYIYSINEMLKQPLADWKAFAPKGQPSGAQGKPVYLVGSFVQGHTVIEEMEANGLQVVGDNCTNSKRLLLSDSYASLDHAGDSIITAIARAILRQRRSPVLDIFADVFARDYAEITRKNARAVIFLTQQYCEPYDYLYAFYHEKLSAVGIPLFKIQQSLDGGYALRFSTIASML